MGEEHKKGYNNQEYKPEFNERYEIKSSDFSDGKVGVSSLERIALIIGVPIGLGLALGELYRAIVRK